MPNLEDERFGGSHVDDSDIIVVNCIKEDIDAQVENTTDNDSIKDGCADIDLNDNATIGCDLTTKGINNEDVARTASDDVANDNNTSNTVSCDSDDVTSDEDVNMNEDTTAGSDEDSNDLEGFDDESISEEEELEECEVCLMTSGLSSIHKRPCCHLQVCSKCMKTYVTTTVAQGVIHVECPGNGCDVLVPDYSILAWLVEDERGVDLRRFLLEAKSKVSGVAKACPRCSHLHNLVKEELAPGGGQERQKWYRQLRKKATGGRKKSDNDDSSTGQRGEATDGRKVTCEQCGFIWCYPCHAPWHEGMTCTAWRRAEYKEFKKWTQQLDNEHLNQLNAQRCPQCKVYISRIIGCNHMRCSRCSTFFCYDCGERLFKYNRGNSCNNCRFAAEVTMFLMGNHRSRLAPRGCARKFLPNSKVLRRSVRGSVLVGKILAGVTLAGPAVALGVSAAVVVASVCVVAVPVYQCVKVIQNRRKAAKHGTTIAHRLHGNRNANQSAMAVTPPLVQIDDV